MSSPCDLRAVGKPHLGSSPSTPSCHLAQLLCIRPQKPLSPRRGRSTEDMQCCRQAGILAD